MEGAHVLWWAIRSPRTRSLFLRWQRDLQTPDELLVRFDPTLTRTIDLAVGSQLVLIDTNSNLVLLPSGRNLAADAWAMDDVLELEKEFLSALPRRITQKSIQNLLEWK